MTPGVMATLVAHASAAFLLEPIKECAEYKINGMGFSATPSYGALLNISKDCFEQWMCGGAVKEIRGAKDVAHLERAMDMAEDAGINYFVVLNEDGEEACVGFVPMEADTIDKIGEKFRLWRV